ncbi:MAG: hypothetical protein WC656_01845 [Sulfurimonas sp.]|jgi:fucose permease
MKFLKYTDLKEIEKQNPEASKKAVLKSMILAATIAAVIIVLAPMIKDYGLFVGLFFGVVSFLTIYSTTMYEVKLLRKLGNDEKGAEKELGDA